MDVTTTKEVNLPRLVTPGGVGEYILYGCVLPSKEFEIATRHVSTLLWHAWDESAPRLTMLEILRADVSSEEASRTGSWKIVGRASFSDSYCSRFQGGGCEECIIVIKDMPRLAIISN